MSFEKMQDREGKMIHERSCVMLYHFTAGELKQIQNVARMMGVKDQIILKVENGENTILEILENQLSSSQIEMTKEKAMIFNNVPSTRMHAFIEALKKCRINRPLIAVVTETSVNWTLKELLMNLAEERAALRENRQTTHN